MTDRIVQENPIYRSLMALRVDAMDREMLDLAIVYGWSLMRIGEQHVQEAMKQIGRHR